MAPDGPIEGREAMEPWNHPRAMEGHRGLFMAHTSFHCLGLYVYILLSTTLHLKDCYSAVFTNAGINETFKNHYLSMC